MNVRTRSIIRSHPAPSVLRPAGPADARAAPAPCPRPPAVLAEPPPTCAGLEFLMFPTSSGTSVEGRSPHRGLVMSISPTQASGLVEVAPDPSRALVAGERRQLIEEVVVLDVFQERHGLYGGSRPRPRGAPAPSDVTFPGADCVSVSAAFFSPSHDSNRSLSHHVASIPAMIAWWLRGSNSSRLSSWMSARMNSSSAGPLCPDVALPPRSKPACSISSATIAGSVSIGSGGVSQAARP